MAKSQLSAHNGAMNTQPDLTALTIQFLSWVAAKPRSYDETMDAWRTSCPRLTIWEDAMSEGLIALNGAGSMKARAVVLTERGYALLNGHRAALNGYELVHTDERAAR